MATKNSRKERKISNKQDLLMISLSDFFDQDNNNIPEMLPIIHGTSKISLRIIDWFVTNFAKKNNTAFLIDDKKGGKKQFIVYLNYKSQLKAYSKKQFDPFCRRERLSLSYGKQKELVTTVGQLNFFRWAIENEILKYIDDHLAEIEEDMNVSIRSVYNKRNRTRRGKNTKDTKLRRKRQELSVSASKSVSKHQVSILVEFS